MMNNNASLDRQLRTLRKRSTFTLFLTWLALFFTVVGISAGYKNFLRVHDKARVAQDAALSVASLVPTYATKEAVESLHSDISKSLNKVSAQSAAEMSQINAVKESNIYITEALNKQVEQLTFQQNTQHMTAETSQSWKVNEASYLLQVATRKLSLDKDVSAAKEALLLADQVLSKAAMPNLLMVRAQIAKDIVMLNGYKPLLLDGVVIEIDRLSKRLKPEATTVVTDEQPQTLLKITETDGRNSVLNRVKESINKVVVVRSYDENLAKRISGDTEGVRYALLQLKLEGLKLLALKQQQAAYDSQLAQIIEQLQESPEPLDSSVTQSIETLKSFKLTAEVPSIASAELLSAALSEERGAVQ
jgi:uncharacterized protein HemX